MSERDEFTAKTKERASLRAGAYCEQCGCALSTGNIHYDHIIPCALGGTNDLSNCQVLCKTCHKGKTGKHDIPRIAKARRNYRKSRGIKRPSRLPGSRNSNLKKKLNGEVVKR